jgi:hypothetical protein
MNNKFSVDRARFLAVATALAGLASFQACTTGNSDDEPGDGGAGMTNAGSKSTAGSSAAAGNGGASAEGGMSSGGASEGGASEGGASEGGAPEGGATVGGAGQGGASDGGAGGAPMVCDDTVGDPACEGVTEACAPYCNAAKLNLKPAAAVAAVTCLEADTTGNCDAGYGCLADATALGCAEDVAASCAAAEAESACGAPDQGDPACAQLLSGFNETARASVIECLEGASCFSVYSCAEGFLFE